MKPLTRGERESFKKKKGGSFEKRKFSVKISNGKFYDSFVSNLKGVTAILAQVWGLLLFRNTSREGSVIFLILFDKHDNC